MGGARRQQISLKRVETQRRRPVVGLLFNCAAHGRPEGRVPGAACWGISCFFGIVARLFNRLRLVPVVVRKV